jgi:nucleoside-diphosphate-sugar epimerase
MRLLILGGTRFTGRALAGLLANIGHDVTVSSRRPENAPKGVQTHGGERGEAMVGLARERPFDAVVDFTAYDADSTRQALDAFSKGRYFLISSIWVTKLHHGMLADTPAPIDVSAPHDLPAVTRKYIEDKASAEFQVRKAHSTGRMAVALRLPILWGLNDHTGRLDFYRRRVTDGGAQILVDGGTNYAQLGWSEDVAGAIARLVTADAHELPPLLEGLPGNGTTVIKLNELIAAEEGVLAQPVAVPRETLAREFPAFLDYEPLWREESLPVSRANLFTVTGWVPHALKDWLGNLVSQVPLRSTNHNVRAEELAFLRRHGHA